MATKKNNNKITNKKENKEFVKNPVRNTMSDRTRYTIIGVVSAIIVGLIIGLIVYNNNSNKKSANIMDQFYETFNSDSLQVVLFARTSCGYCELEKPILKQISEDYNMKYLDIDTDEMTKTDIEKMVNELGITGATPTTVIVQKGKVVATQEGYLDGQQYVEFFVKNKILPEGSVYKPEKELNSISFEEYKKLVKENKYNAILIDSIACQMCINVRSMLSKIAEKNEMKINYLSAVNISEEDSNSFIKMLEELKYDEEKYKSEGTVNVPLFIITKDNKIVDYLVIDEKEEDYTELLKKYEFIK